jgi:hypothetical protein
MPELDSQTSNSSGIPELQGGRQRDECTLSSHLVALTFKSRYVAKSDRADLRPQRTISAEQKASNLLPHVFLWGEAMLESWGKLFLSFVLAVLCIGCTTTPSYLGRDCEAEAAFDACVDCFIANGEAGRYAYASSPPSRDVVSQAGSELKTRVRSGRMSTAKARSLFTNLVRDVNNNSSPSAEFLAESIVRADHPYLLALKPPSSSGAHAVEGKSPCVYGNCGSVSVKGYYRKDGTYVRPHTRSSGGGRRK